MLKKPRSAAHGQHLKILFQSKWYCSKKLKAWKRFQNLNQVYQDRRSDSQRATTIAALDRKKPLTEVYSEGFFKSLQLSQAIAFGITPYWGFFAARLRRISFGLMVKAR